MLFRSGKLAGERVAKALQVIQQQLRPQHLLKGEDHREDHQAVFIGEIMGDQHEAIAHLEALREKGGEYLLFPETSSFEAAGLLEITSQ